MNLTPAGLKALSDGDTENFIAASTPGGIEAQEAAGQVSFVAMQTLPRECPKQELESLGFVFEADPLEGVIDDIFINVEFPDGWTKKATDHSMWSDLIDEKGRKRGGLFYKAAFYDQRAFMRLDKRYSCMQNHDLEDSIQYQVFDCDKVIYETDVVKASMKENMDEYFSAQDKLENLATVWLDINFPDYKDTSEYWD